MCVLCVCCGQGPEGGYRCTRKAECVCVRVRVCGHEEYTLQVYTGSGRNNRCRSGVLEGKTLREGVEREGGGERSMSHVKYSVPM